MGIVFGVYRVVFGQYDTFKSIFFVLALDPKYDGVDDDNRISCFRFDV